MLNHTQCIHDQWRRWQGARAIFVYRNEVSRYPLLMAGALLVFAFPLFSGTAKASGSIATMYVATKSPAAGQTLSVQAGVTTDDPSGWAASDYSLVLRLLSSDGRTVAESAAIPGTQPVATGQVTTVFLQWQLPADSAGYYQLELALLHRGTLAFTSSPATLVIKKPAPPTAGCSTGSMKSTALFGAQTSETTLFALNGCLGPGRGSYILNGGFSSAPGTLKPLIELDTPQMRLQGGTLTPQFDPLAFDGVTGNGAVYQQTWGAQQLQLSWLREPGDPVGPSFAAIHYSMTTPNVVAGFGAGHARAFVDPDPGALSTWNDGNFAAFSFAWQPAAQRNSYGVRAGLVNYADADGITRHTDGAFEAFATLNIGATQWSLDELRTGPFYLAPGAPALIADRDVKTISGSFSLGQVSATLYAQGYRDNLPGANLPVSTNNWTENAVFSIPIHQDVATVTFTGAVQQQDGDFPSVFSTNGVTAVYVLRRGAQSVQFSYGITGSNGGTDQQQTQATAGIAVSRAIAQGLSFTLGTNVAAVRASSSDAASTSRTNFLTLSLARDPWTVFASLTDASNQPGSGIAPPQQLSLNEGVAFQLPNHFTLKFSMTKINGSTPVSNGNIALGTQF